MSLKSKFLRTSLSFCLILCLSILTFADTIRLKDGSIIKGKVVGFRNGQFVVVIGDGARQRQMTFFSDEIEAIEFEPGSMPINTSVNRPATTPAPRANSNNPDNVNTVAGDTNTSQPINTQTTSPRVSTTDNTTPNTSPTNSTVNTNSTRPKPIRLNLKVLADTTSNGWTNAGWVVKKGQRIKINGTGRVSLGGGNFSTPSGNASLFDKDKLMQNQPTGGLIAVIGDDNNDFIFIGASREFTATRDGALFLGINEGVLDNNSGSFDVVIEIDPS